MRKILILSTTVLLFVGCSQQKDKTYRPAEGGRVYGGVFKLNEVQDITSMHPLSMTEVSGYQVASQVYEGLVKPDQGTLEPIPALAERWESNEDATEWTFYLRKGVRFHDDACFPEGKGRELKATDIQYCFEQLCTPSEDNQMFWLVRDRLVGARDFYNAQLNGEDQEDLACIEVLDDYTVKVKLAFPFASFLRLMCHTSFYIYPIEAVTHYGDSLHQHPVGTGPFQMKENLPDEIVVLERNPNYWAQDEFGNQLPYLDGVQVSFVRDKKSELLMFKNKKLDMIFTLPIEMYSDVMGALPSRGRDGMIPVRAEVTPSLSAHYLAFQHDHPVFSDPKVRRAFNMAVDRESLVKYTLQGEGTPGIYGFVPPVFPEYPHKKIKGHVYDPKQAAELLAEAGYADGDGFPKVIFETTSGGQNYEVVAEVVKQMLEENLNVQVEIKTITMAELTKIEESGEAMFWRSGWLADYPDPENFLCLFLSEDSDEHSASYLNPLNYSSPVYDSLYDAAIRTTDIAERNQRFVELDQLLVDDAVILPLYYEEFTRLIPRYIKNFPQNPMEHRDFGVVWFDYESMKGEEAE